ncbi:MEDS domain-containing protein [Cellulomonas sp. 179-A 4D5 NHS]|uniref:MEDS domain-containing protein n=1 Tax=Cellulomonas sp. 179-A 4D5 NHS TaxID=3142378 RepID=UPI00399F0A95
MITTHPERTFRHDLVLHDGTDDLVRLMAPFLREGAAAGERTVVLGRPDVVDALLAAVPEVTDALALREQDHERFAGRDLHRAQQLLARLDSEGTTVRIVNQMPVATTPEQWHEWRRYEAAANVVLAPYRAWGKCAHDARTIDPGMLEDLRATHAHVEDAHSGGPNADFDEAGTRTRTFFEVPAHPTEASPPTLALVDPSSADARRAVRDLALRAGLPETAQETVILATSEAVENAWTHGRAPVLVRGWLDRPGRVTVAVSDTGPGPHPLVGLLPASPGSPYDRGGMWMVQVLLRDVHHRTGPGGYTVTFSVDDDPVAPPRA